MAVINTLRYSIRGTLGNGSSAMRQRIHSVVAIVKKEICTILLDCVNSLTTLQ